MKEDQYEAFTEGKENLPILKNPLHDDNTEKDAWERCYKIAGQVIEGELPDPTDGANHYFDDSIPAPYWAADAEFKIKIDTLNFYFL